MNQHYYVVNEFGDRVSPCTNLPHLAESWAVECELERPEGVYTVVHAESIYPRVDNLTFNTIE
jgi:hypothetical protein